ncbi:MAG: hypothetical protein WBQ60_01040, partial [Asticcacaulis sp.]
LANGAVAYGAIVAMQDASFRASLRGYAADASARAEMVSRLLSNTTYAAAIPGADSAARRMILALSSDGQVIYKAGAAVKQTAYDIQKQKWSREFVADRDGRLALARTNSVTLSSVQSDESAQLLTAALTGSGLVTRAKTGQSTGTNPVGPVQDASLTAATATATPVATPPVATTVTSPEGQSVFDRPDLFNLPYSEAINRGLTIAALAILGEGGPERSSALISLLNDGSGPQCLSMSKLMLYQCLAVAKPHYEDVFCLGQHVLMDTGQCIGKMSSNALSFAPVTRVGFKADGTSAYADPKPYLKPVTVAKKTTKKKKK